MSKFLENAKLDATNESKLVREFYEETLKVLKDNDKTEEDVRWVGNTNGDICMSFAEFTRHSKGFKYLPRGRCAFLTTADETPVSYFTGEQGFMNRIPVDLVVVGDDFMLRRFIHTRMSEADPARTGAIYNETPEYWEFIKLPKRNSPFLVDNMNEVRLFATDNVTMARNLLTLNTEKGKNDPDFKRFDEMQRNVVHVKRTNAPKRKIGRGGI